MHKQPFKKRRTSALVATLSAASVLSLGAYVMDGSSSPTLAAVYQPARAAGAISPSFEQFLATHGGHYSARLARLWRARFGPGAPGPEVSGIVRGPSGAPLEEARVTLRFRDASGRLLREVTVRVGARGRFGKWAPPGTTSVSLVVGEGPGGRIVTGTFPLRSRTGLDTTVTFPARRSSLLPAVFPY